ncbi:Putative Sh3 domain containing protein [Rhizopus microsporus]|nr:Putative Sh3 domain containing protein [Rhizopus microsporus]
MSIIHYSERLEEIHEEQCTSEEEDTDDDEMTDASSSMSSSPSIPDENINFDLVYALHTFVATVEGQASVVKGDALILMEDTNIYWWLVEVLKTNEVGYIPAENIETPYERLARLNKHRNVEITSPSMQDTASQTTMHPLTTNVRRVIISDDSKVYHYEVESEEEEDEEDEEDMDQENQAEDYARRQEVYQESEYSEMKMDDDEDDLIEPLTQEKIEIPQETPDDGPLQELRVFAGNIGQGPFFHTFLISYQTAAEELVQLAIDKFGIQLQEQDHSATIEYYVAVQGLDGDEYILLPQDKPLSIFKTLTDSLTTPMPSVSHIRRISQQSVSSVQSSGTTQRRPRSSSFKMERLVLSNDDLSSTNSTSGFPCIGIFKFLCEEDEEPLPGSPAQTAKSPTGFTTQLILCTSVGFVCFLLFCFLRVRWSNIYSPRLRMKKHAPEQLPTSFFGWIIPLLKTPDSVIMEKVGLDAVVMLQFLLMSVKLFSFCGFFGTVVLYPISKMGGDFANGTNPNNTHSLLTTAITTSHSISYLWVYLFFTYLFVFATFYFTFLNYRGYVRIRREFLLRKAKTLSARTLLVTGIPPHLRSDRKLAEYFEKLGIGVVESVHTIRHVGRLLEFIKERTQYLRQLETWYTKWLGNPCFDPNYDPDDMLNEDGPSSRAIIRRDRPLMSEGLFCGAKVDAIDYYTNKFNEVDELVVKARKVGKFLPTSVGFITFEEAISAVR